MGSNEKSRWEEGFTLPEALAAVLILSLGSLLFVFGGRTVTTNIVEIKEKKIFLSEIVLCDRILREKIGRVEIPYWEQNLNLAEETDQVALSYFEGEREKTLTLRIDEKGFRISSLPEAEIVFSTLEEGSFSPVVKHGIVAGLSWRIKREGEEYRNQALFGSIPLLSRGVMDD